MSRISTLVWVLVIVISSFLLYRVKYKVQSLRTQVAEISHELESERETLHVVAAEWAYLNRPERLQSLSRKYLSSQTVMVEQIAEIEAIPFVQKTKLYSASDRGAVPVSAVMLNMAGDRR